MQLIKKEVILLIFILILPLTYAEEIELNNYDDLEFDLEISSSVNIIHLKSDYAIDFISANLSIFPRDSEWQKVISKELISNPQINILEEENNFYYRWESPTETQLDFGYKGLVKTETNFKKVKNKVKFPIEVEGLEEFISPTLTITSEDVLIIDKAAELAEGEDDLYVLVHKIGLWTKDNVEYSLETLTAEVSQSASWVFENKKGVCDELTALFIAMLRSLKIPARVVIGSSYTNVLNDFGNHAWAEVYFPGQGWIAFDPTYGQLGYVDSTHIKLRDSIDIKESSIQYSWRSRDIDVESNEININVRTIKMGNLFKENLEMEVKLLKNEVKGGSQVPIQVDIKNLNNYYLPLTLFITKAPTKIPNNIKHILLKPNEEKSVFFIIPIPSNLKEGFSYTSTIEFGDNFNNTRNQLVYYANNNPLYTLEEAENKINQLREEEEKVYSSDVNLECTSNKNSYYEYEDILISCTIENKGNTNLKDIEICILNNCTNLDLKIAEKTLFTFNPFLSVGTKELAVSAENQDLAKFSFIDLEVVPEPNLKITGLDYSRDVNYKDTYKITFDLNSESEIKDVIIKINNEEIFNLENFNGKDQFVIPFEGNFFYRDNNPNIKIEYKNKNNQQYVLEEPLSINVIKIPLIQRLGLYIILVGLVFLTILFLIFKKH